MKQCLINRILSCVHIYIISCALYNPAVSAMWTQDDLIHAVRELSIIDVYDMLSKCSKKVNEPDSQGRYALHEAIKLETKDSVDKVIFLLNWGADAQKKQEGKTALQIAVDEGTAENGGDAKIRALLRLYYLHSHRRFDKSEHGLGLGMEVDTYPVPTIESKGVYGMAFQDIVAQEREYTNEKNRDERKKKADELMDIVNFSRYSGNCSKSERDCLEKLYTVAEAKRLLAEGVSPNAHGYSSYYMGDSLYDTLGDQDAKSIAFLELLLRKGGKVERIYGNGYMRRPFKVLWASGTISFRNKVAKFKLLLDAGIDIDFSLAQRPERKCYREDDKSNDSQQEQIFAAAVAQGRNWRELLPGYLKDYFPAKQKYSKEQEDGDYGGISACTQKNLIRIVGEYAVPYYNYDLERIAQRLDWKTGRNYSDPLSNREDSPDIILTSLFMDAVAQGRSWRELLPDQMRDCFPEKQEDVKPVGICAYTQKDLIRIVGEYAFPYYSNDYNYDTPELDKHNPKKLAHYLIEAMEEYDLEKMEQLLDLGADPYYSRRGMHRLYEALRDSRKQSVGVMQLLVRKGFDVNRECRGESLFEKLLYIHDDKAQKYRKLDLLMEGGIKLDFANVRRMRYLAGKHSPAAQARIQKWGEFEQHMLDRVKQDIQAHINLIGLLKPHQETPNIVKSLLRSNAGILINQYAYPYWNLVYQKQGSVSDMLEQKRLRKKLKLDLDDDSTFQVQEPHEQELAKKELPEEIWV